MTTVASATAMRSVLALSDERDRWLARILAAERAGYARVWDAAVAALADAACGRLMPDRPTDLEILRWGKGGRAHFADPRPGDFLGRSR